jgi:hypothetical protein
MTARWHIQHSPERFSDRIASIRSPRRLLVDSRRSDDRRRAFVPGFPDRVRVVHHDDPTSLAYPNRLEPRPGTTKVVLEAVDRPAPAIEVARPAVAPAPQLQGLDQPAIWCSASSSKATPAAGRSRCCSPVRRATSIHRWRIRLVDERQRRAIGAEIIAGYQRVPETPEELSSAETNARAMIADEPW